MSFPSKEVREKCWGARDELWKCLDDNNGDQSACAKFREMYTNLCPKQWVKHFDRKREYLKFKDRIYAEGSRMNADVMIAEEHNIASSSPPVPEGITLEIVTGHQRESLLNVQSTSTTTTSCNSDAIKKSPSPRIFRKFQPPTFS